MKKEVMLKAFTDISDEYILEAAPAGYLPKAKKAPGWFNLRMLAGALAVLLIAVISTVTMRRPDQPGQDIELVTPYRVVETLAEAESITGFAMECPETIDDWKISQISVYTGSMTEVIYEDGSGETAAKVRKAAGSDDISGDYNPYEQETILEADGRQITAKGENDLIELMTWTENGYSWSVSLSDPVSSEKALEIVSGIH